MERSETIWWKTKEIMRPRLLTTDQLFKTTGADASCTRKGNSIGIDFLVRSENGLAMNDLRWSFGVDLSRMLTFVISSPGLYTGQDRFSSPSSRHDQFSNTHRCCVLQRSFVIRYFCSSCAAADMVSIVQQCLNCSQRSVLYPLLLRQ